MIGRPAVAEAIEDRGIRVSGRTELHVRPEASSDPKALEDCEIVLLTVKAYDTAKAALEVGEAAPMTMLVTLQNGLDNDEQVASTAPGLSSCAAITSFGVTYLGPGHVRHAGDGETVLGRMACSPSEANRTADLINEAGLPVSFVENIRGHVWLKGIVNHCINPLTVIHRCKNGTLLEVEEYSRHLEGLCDEAMQVINAAVVRIPSDDVLGRVKEVARLTAENRSSMLQDVDRGKRTEIDHITGHLIKTGKLHGLDLPLSEFVYYEVKHLEEEAGPKGGDDA
jgi:2-dehydropantoate 2-reductase